MNHAGPPVAEHSDKASGVAARLWAWLFPPPAGVGGALLGHQRQALRRQVPILVFVTWAISALTAAVFYPLVAPALNLAWVGLVWLMGGLSLWRWSQSRHIAKPRPATVRFVRRSILASAVPGIVWGASALIFFTPDRMELQVFLICVLAGMSAGIVAAAPSMPAAALAYVMPAMVPMTIQLLGTGVRTSVVMGVMAVIYMCALVFLLRNGHRSFCDGVVAEERARRAEEVLRDSIESLSDGYVLYDSDLRVVRHNRRFLDYIPKLGAGESAVGKTYESLMREGLARGFFSSDDEFRRNGAGAMSAWIAALRSPEQSAVERKLADGRTLLARKYPMANGSCVVILSDISALTQVQDRFVAAMDAMDDALVLYGPDDRIITHNRRYLDLYPVLKDLAPLAGRTRAECLTHAVRAGYIAQKEIGGDAERWVAGQVRQLQADKTAEYEREMADGRTYLIRARETAEGGRVMITTDITALKRAEQRLFAAIEAMDDGFVLYGPDDTILLHNKRYLEQYPQYRDMVPLAGRPGRELMRRLAETKAFRGVDEAGGPERWAEAQLDFVRARGSTEFERETADGRSYLIRTQNTGEGGRVAITTDITAVKLAQQRLLDAINAMDDGFILFGPDDRVRLYNQRYLDHFPALAELGPLVGRSREDLIRAMAAAKAFAGKAQDGDTEAWIARQRNALNGGKAAEYERRLADGRTLLVRAQPTAEGGHVAITTDVTALKRAQKRLVDAVESMSDAFVLWDADDRLVLINSAYARMFEGVPRATEVGTRFEDILRAGIANGAFPDAEGREEQYFDERMARHRNPVDPVVQPYRDGRWLRYSERQTSEGGIVGLRTDVTAEMRREQALRFSEAELAKRVQELEAMQQQLHEQRDELQQLMRQVMQARDEAAAANAAKSIFLANMSHELRTPLNAIIGFSEIMNGELFGALGHPRYQSYVGDMLGAAKHLLKLINDILDLSKIEAGKWELREEPVDVRRMLDAVMRLFRGRDEMARLEIKVDAPASLPPIMADERALKQVLINALSNSIKFTPAGGRIRMRARRDQSGRLHLAIGDTGIGIRREDVQKALAPFGQVDNHMTRRHQGTGLGLSIAKALVERHGGRLKLRSRPGRGTVVTATLPAERFAAAAQAKLVAAE